MRHNYTLEEIGERVLRCDFHEEILCSQCLKPTVSGFIVDFDESLEFCSTLQVRGGLLRGLGGGR